MLQNRRCGFLTKVVGITAFLAVFTVLAPFSLPSRAADVDPVGLETWDPVSGAPYDTQRWEVYEYGNSTFRVEQPGGNYVAHLHAVDNSVKLFSHLSYTSADMIFRYDITPLSSEDEKGQPGAVFNAAFSAEQRVWYIEYNCEKDQFWVYIRKPDGSDWGVIQSSAAGLPRDRTYRVEVAYHSSELQVTVTDLSTNAVVVQASGEHYQPAGAGQLQFQAWTDKGGNGQGAYLDNIEVRRITYRLGSPGQVPAGTDLTTVLQATDLAGSPYGTYNGTATVLANGPSGQISTELPFVSGQAQLPLGVQTKAGQIQIGIQDKAESNARATLGITVTPAAPAVLDLSARPASKVHVGFKSILTLAVTDAYSNPIPGAQIDLSVQSPDDTATVTSSVTTDGNGQATAVLTVSRQPGENVVTARLRGTQLTATATLVATEENLSKVQPPVLLAPADGSSVTQARPTFSWQPSAGATRYTLEYSRQPGFEDASSFTVVVVPEGTTSAQPAADLGTGIWYWRVGAWDDYGYMYSPVRSLTVVSLDSSAMQIPFVNVVPNIVRSGTEEVRIYYVLSQDAAVAARIYTASGKLVRSFSNPPGQQGNNELSWDGRDTYGDFVPNGLYYLVIRVVQPGKPPVSVTRRIGVFR